MSSTGERTVARSSAAAQSTNVSVTNPANGEYPCWRHEAATTLLGGITGDDALSIAKVAAVIDAVQVARPSGWTTVTLVADLASRTIALSDIH